MCLNAQDAHQDTTVKAMETSFLMETAQHATIAAEMLHFPHQ